MIVVSSYQNILVECKCTFIVIEHFRNLIPLLDHVNHTPNYSIYTVTRKPHHMAGCRG